MKNLIILLSICFCLQACPKEKLGRYPLFFVNRSKSKIKVGITPFLNNTPPMYPDTSLPTSDTQLRGPILPNDTLIIYNKGSWENYYKQAVPSGVMSFFVFDADTLEKYPWDTIRSRYMILARYDLTIQDFESNNYTITYPR